MPLHIEDDAKQWLQKKQKPVTIQLVDVESCCAPSVSEATISFHTPKHQAQFEQISMYDTAIYIKKPLLANYTITLKLAGFGPFKLLSTKLAPVAVTEV
ncbi:CC/Se motif family (seleno)protein [Caryophanon tenue]|uniref:FeS cluster biogenesis domain-containing protein n=1 Tax=Caryophanon tenue TaxID=33978 RepID=A0A1C0YBZ0_9BACL|nr:CC/Se motif family (seleno)protein [Caryophanon tenue]OCS84649.1 hypothetical protein A6M13_03480 [Caryophanon tenue]